MIEKESKMKHNVLDLTKTPVGIPNVVQFSDMWQINKHTGFKRKVQRLTGQDYPLATGTLNVTRASPSKGASLPSDTINGRMASSHAKAVNTTVAKKGAKSASTVNNTKKIKVEHYQGTAF